MSYLKRIGNTLLKMILGALQTVTKTLEREIGSWPPVSETPTPRPLGMMGPDGA